MKKSMLCLCLCAFLATAAFGEKLAVKVNLGGTFLMGGDYNKWMVGFRDYELSVLGASETFVDSMKKLNLGYQFGAEVLYNFSPSLAVGIEAGYLSASVTSHLERTWHDYKWTVNPTLSAIPVTLNIHYFKPLGEKIKLHAMAGAGVFLASYEMIYTIEDTANPYSGTWSPDSQAVFGAKAGIGIEYPLTKKLALTFDVTGRYAQVKGFTGPYEGIRHGAPYSGIGTQYFYYYDSEGKYPLLGVYDSEPSGEHFQDLRLARYSLSGVSLLVGVKISL
jgi:opacity protein-like surface antigen